MHRQIKFRQFSIDIIWWVGSGNITTTGLVAGTSVNSEASFEDGVVQVPCQRAPDIPYESPLSFRQTSRKNERRSEAWARRGYLWVRQVQRIYAMSAWKRDVLEHSSGSIFALRHLDRTFELGEAFRLRVRRMTIMYDIIVRKNKTAKLKSAKWNWRPIRQIKFPPNFPAIRYSIFVYVFTHTINDNTKPKTHCENCQKIINMDSLTWEKKELQELKWGESICLKGHIFMVLKIMCAASEQALWLSP